jgi:hypothetical protein
MDMKWVDCSRWLLLAALVTAVSLAQAAGKAAGRAHVHGVASLDIAVSADSVSIELDTPLDNVVGFERMPRTEGEREKLNAAVQRLRDGAALFRIDPAAACTLARAELASPVLRLDPGPGSAAAGEHLDMRGSYLFNCKAGAKASFVEVGLFEAFGGFKRIELQVLTPKGQLKATLRRPASRVVLAR